MQPPLAKKKNTKRVVAFQAHGPGRSQSAHSQVAHGPRKTKKWIRSASLPPPRRPYSRVAAPLSPSDPATLVCDPVGVERSYPGMELGTQAEPLEANIDRSMQAAPLRPKATNPLCSHLKPEQGAVLAYLGQWPLCPR